MNSQRPLSTLPQAEELFYSAAIGRDLLLDFFMLFSRFECALKRARCTRALDAGSSAGADWDDFAKRSRAAWLASPGPAMAQTNYLCAHPPHRQVVGDDKSVSWKTVSPVDSADLVAVLAAVRRVRNNLFHGGKYVDGPVTEPARNRELVDAALHVLKACVSLSSSVNAAFPDDSL